MWPADCGRHCGGKCMRHIDRADQVDLQDGLPVGRLELPERKAKLARSDADGEDDVVTPAESLLDFQGRLAHGRVVGHVGRQGQTTAGARRPGHGRSGSRSMAATRAPSATKARAIAAPIPRAAPKTTTTFVASPRSTLVGSWPRGSPPGFDYLARWRPACWLPRPMSTIRSRIEPSAFLA